MNVDRTIVRSGRHGRRLNRATPVGQGIDHGSGTLRVLAGSELAGVRPILRRARRSLPAAFKEIREYR